MQPNHPNALDDPRQFDDLWDFADPARSEQRFRELLADPRVAAIPALAVEIETQIARTLGLRRRFDEARAMLDAVLPRIVPNAADSRDSPDSVASLDHAMARARIRWLLERGRTYASAIHSDDPAAAMRHFVEAWDLARLHGEERLAIDAAHMAAIVAPGGAEQERWNLDALALAQTASDPKARRWQGSLLNNLGMTYHAAQRYDEALDAFQRMRAMREAAGNPSAVFIAHWMIAWTLRFMGRHDEALAILLRLEAEAAARGEPDGFVFEELGENALAMGDREAAGAWFGKAYPLLAEDPSVRTDPVRLERLHEMAVTEG